MAGQVLTDLPVALFCRSCAPRLRLHAKQISSQKIVGWAKRQRAHHSGGALADRWCHSPTRTRWSSSTSVRAAHGCPVHEVAKVWCRDRMVGNARRLGPPESAALVET